jgi:hypothetical protein
MEAGSPSFSFAIRVLNSLARSKVFSCWFIDDDKNIVRGGEHER